MADVIYILSGGVSPDLNNYSQYLQAKTLADYFAGQTDVELELQFGAGHIPNTPDDKLHDVKKIELDENGEKKIVYIQGELEGNSAATRENVDAYFAQLKHKDWNKEDRFVMFVGDHGSPTTFDLSCLDFQQTETDYRIVHNYRGNCINLWAPGIDFYPEKSCLDVDSLKNQLEASVPENIPVIIIMTQCYSGGFHRIGYDLDENGFPKKNSNQTFAAFTSIHDQTTAAGCTSFVENDRYDGYERRIAEAFTGTNVVTGEAIADPAPSILAAHLSASLLDRTKDTPLRTSEAFLIDAYIAYKKHDESGSLDKDLEKIWDQLLENPDVVKIDANLKNDLMARLKYIEDTQNQIKTWFPTMKSLDLDQGLSELRAQITTIAEMESATADLLQQKQDELKKIMAGPKNAYMDAASEKQLGDKIFEWETRDILFKPNLSAVRYMQEDPTLQRYAEYKNYQENWDDTVYQWAITNSEKNFEDLDKVPVLKAEIELLDAQATDYEILAACLERLEQQMIVATMTIWLDSTSQTARNQEQQILQDFGKFVQAETQARI